MKIVKAEVFVTCPGRNFVTLKITTEDGITGLGDATLNGRELSVASYLQDHLCPQLIGRDAHRIEDIWQFFYKGAYWRRGPVTMSAISAVDMALWDIKAKAANMPLYQLLGGASREGVMVYCHTTGHSIDEALDDYARHQELGFKAIRVQCGIPGMKTTYGMSKGKGLAYEPATKGQWPEEQLWSTEKYLDFMPKLFDAVRNKFGFNEHLLHDMHHRLTPIEAARFGKSIEDQRCDGVAAEKSNATVVAKQRFGKGSGILRRGLHRLTLQILQRSYVTGRMVVSQLLHGGTFQIVPQLQNAFGGLFIRQPTMILHDGHQRIKASCLGIVRHGHALPRCDIKKAKTVQFPQAFMHHCLADLHGISQLPLGGQLVAGAQFT